MAGSKGKLKRSPSDAAYYKNYSYETNRRKRLEKLAKEQPNNEQIQSALKNIHYRRKTPSKKLGWVDRRDTRIVGGEHKSQDGKATNIDPAIGKQEHVQRARACAREDAARRAMAFEQKKSNKAHPNKRAKGV